MRRFAATVTAVIALALSGTSAAGVVWSPIGPYGGTIEAVVVEPGSLETVYAATRSGVWKSVNGGAHWRPRSSGLTEMWVHALAIDPFNSQRLYAATLEGTFRSTDGALSWSKVGPSGVNIAVSASEVGTLYVDGARSRNGGETWTRVIAEQVGAIAIHPGDADVVYASTPEAFLKSTDGGESWETLDLDDPWGGPLVIDPFAPDTLYLPLTSGVVRSEDGGETWAPFAIPGGLRAVALPSSSPGTIFAYGRSGGFARVSRSDNGGQTWGPSVPIAPSTVSMLTVVPSADAGIVYAGTFGRGFHRSVDGGASFAEANVGLAAEPARAVAFDRGSPGTVYASLGFDAFRSLDNGLTWTKLQGLDEPGQDLRIEGLAVDASSTLYAARARFGMQPGSTPAQVLRSDDGGAQWRPAHFGLPFNSYPRSLYADPRTSGTLFATAEWSTVLELYGGLFKTTNGGESWTSIAPTDAPVGAVAFHPASGRIALAEGVRDGIPDERFYVSDDWGASWHRERYPSLPILSLAFGHSPDTIYAGGGISKSTDGGATWTRLTLREPDEVRALAVDPADPQLVYAGSQEHGLWSSADGGDTWAALSPGITGLSVFVLEFAPPQASTSLAAASRAEPPLYLGLAARGRGGTWRLIPAPTNLRRPSLTGRAKVGRTLTCSPGRWARTNRVAYRWRRGGRPIPKATKAHYHLRSADAERRIRCRVTAHGPGGSRQAFSKRQLIDR